MPRTPPQSKTIPSQLEDVKNKKLNFDLNKPWDSSEEDEQLHNKLNFNFDINEPWYNPEEEGEQVKEVAQKVERNESVVEKELNATKDEEQSVQGFIAKAGSSHEEYSRCTPDAENATTAEPNQQFQVPISSSSRVSWADMAQEEDMLDKDEEESRQQRVYIRFSKVGRKKDFTCLETSKGKTVNILEGLELHTSVFNAEEQKQIVTFVYQLQDMGRKGQLRERTFSAPQKWMRGKGRVTIQYGCCYNYAVLKDGRPPDILRDEYVDPIPHLFKMMIRRLIRWHVLPPSCVPDSCIVNIYDEGDCIPPHIDHHDFLRPFCTVSFLSECNILFGSNLRTVGPGEFKGAVAIPLPVGSVLVLNGNGADVAKHCVPAVPTKRISITFRKMDQSKLPYEFVPDPDLQGLQPLAYDVDESNGTKRHGAAHIMRSAKRRDFGSISFRTREATMAPVEEYHSQHRGGAHRQVPSSQSRPRSPHIESGSSSRRSSRYYEDFPTLSRVSSRGQYYEDDTAYYYGYPTPHRRGAHRQVPASQSRPRSPHIESGSSSRRSSRYYEDFPTLSRVSSCGQYYEDDTAYYYDYPTPSKTKRPY